MAGIKSVVAVEPHPDDVEILCMGSLLKLRETGTRITIVCLTNGNKGAGYDLKIGYDEIAAIRFSEASNVAKEIGAEFVNLGAEDGYLYDDPELRNELAAVFRRAEAEVVLAPSPNDYHTDHTIGSEIAFQAAILASLPQAKIQETALERAPATYYYDTITGLEFEPSFFIDVSDVFERKKELIKLHASQMENMSTVYDWDLTDAIESLGRLRGIQSGVKYAEAFALCRRFPRIKAWRDFPS